MSDQNEATGLNRRTMLKGAAGLGAATAVASVLTTSYTASAAVNIGGFIKEIGNFEVLSVSWGAAAHRSSTGSGRTRGRPELQDLFLTKVTDGTSVGFVEAVFVGRSFSEASITISPNDEVSPSISFDLENVTVSSYSGGGSGGELTDNISLAYEKLTFTVGEAGTTGTRL
jgi:type VI protein secretion system component Hcp